MNKHRLMLSAAAAVLLAQQFAARADTTISTKQTTQVTTATEGNITISSTGAVSLDSDGAALVINSNNSLLNQGVISNSGTSGGTAVLIDTSAGNIVAPAGGFVNDLTIQAAGDGTSKTGISISGSNTYFGGITLGATSSLTMVGDESTAFSLANGTKIDGDINISGQITSAPNQTKSDNLGDTLILLDGVVNGNVVLDGGTTANNIGDLVRGVAVLGGIHACSNDAANEAAAGYVCGTAATQGLGALVNAGTLTTVGSVTINTNPKAINLESGSALIVAASIDGGIVNSGPATANTTTTATISANGLTATPTVDIDPGLYTFGSATAVRGPINIGAVSLAIDGINPGYSFINRGNIQAQPADDQLSAAAMFIEGASTTNYTCLGTGDATTCANGGILDTGGIASAAHTNEITNITSTGATSVVTSTALTIGPYAAVPRIDVIAEQSSPGAYTTASIEASVTGIGQGTSTAILIAQNANVPLIDVSFHGTISAVVSTTTIVPTAAEATLSSPFSLLAEGIVDASGTLETINNAGTITASATTLFPDTGAVTLVTQRAIDLLSSSANNVTINNSGNIVGDVLFPSGGNNETLNVGNINGVVNPSTNYLNSPNSYAVVAESISGNNVTGVLPNVTTDLINFGAGTGDVLHVGAFGYVNAVIESSIGGLAVTVDPNGTLYVANTGGTGNTSTGSLNARTFDVNGGTLGLVVSQGSSGINPVIKATNEATIAPNTNLTLVFGGFVSSGTTAATVNNPTVQDVVLINAPTINMSAATLAENNITLSQDLPFLFQASSAPLSLQGVAGTNQSLVMALTPRAPGALNADGTPGLGLSGDALAQFPFVASALDTDPTLGSAVATNLTVYNTPGTPSSGINTAASQQAAQNAFSQFGPDTSGGSRQIAIMLTDEATGPVAARQRLLRSFSDAPGDLTLWSEEFAGMINNKGREDADNSLTNYKDHGFGFTLGVDSGSPQTGWYGGALTYYSGDVDQTLPRDSQDHTHWYMLTGYTEWRGHHLFLDTQASVSYGNFDGTRTMDIGNQDRAALGKRAEEMVAAGANLGASFNFGALEMDPHFSLDGLTLREEGYTEVNGGNGLDLQVAPNYSNSLRVAFGTDFKLNLKVWDFALSPEARFGYRYDALEEPVKIKAGFVSTGGLSTAGNTMTFIGPDPDSGNIFAGLTVGAHTENWELGVNYDVVRGNNGSTTQVGTLSLLGRI